jgi:hypothetical protein
MCCTSVQCDAPEVKNVVEKDTNIFFYIYIKWILFFACLSVRLLLGSCGVFFWVSSFGSVTRQRPNNVVLRSYFGSVPRQRPLSDNGVLFSLLSLLRTRCRENIVLLI